MTETAEEIAHDFEQASWRKLQLGIERQAERWYERAPDVREFIALVPPALYEPALRAIKRGPIRGDVVEPFVVHTPVGPVRVHKLALEQGDVTRVFPVATLGAIR